MSLRAAKLANGRRFIQGGTWMCLALLAGCAQIRPHIDEALLSRHFARSNQQQGADDYRVGCPDQLLLTIDGGPALPNDRPAVAVDGKIDLGNLGRLRVEGLTSSEIAELLASKLGMPVAQVHVQVADYRSQSIYVFGQVKGQERAIPFRGQETVLELLQRVGGITPAAAPESVYVIRSRVAQGGRPEIYPVKLADILVRNDPKTNLSLQPGDQIFIGETRRSSWSRCLPPIFQPIVGGPASWHRLGEGLLGKPARPATEPVAERITPIAGLYPFTGAAGGQ